jgi:serine-type D-Ala-D-Ala endopeptidase (penicillin-binding protein 7)
MKKLLVILTLLSFLGSSFAVTASHQTHKQKSAQSSKKSSLSSKKSKSSKKTSKKKRSRSGYKVATRLRVNSTLDQDQINQSAINRQPRLYSYSALAVNANNNEVLVSKNPNVKMPIASITKLMTAMVVLDADLDLDEYITISPSDIDTLRNTFSRLSVGMQIKRKYLLLLALMSSENRAAHALGRTAYPGGIKEFIQKMNVKARSIGMQHSQFYDPTGLTNANQATAEDLSKMVAHAFKYDLIKKYSTTKQAKVLLGQKYAHRYINSDALVRNGTFPISISKTGFINEAGHCLVLYSIVSGQPIIMVFLNSAGKGGRLVDAVAVKNYIKRIG